jgi:hypothetical protein
MRISEDVLIRVDPFEDRRVGVSKFNNARPPYRLCHE